MNAREFLNWYISEKDTHVSRISSTIKLALMLNEEKKIVSRLIEDISEDLARDRKRQLRQLRMSDNEVVTKYHFNY